MQLFKQVLRVLVNQCNTSPLGICVIIAWPVLPQQMLALEHEQAANRQLRADIDVLTRVRSLSLVPSVAKRRFLVKD